MKEYMMEGYVDVSLKFEETVIAESKEQAEEIMNDFMHQGNLIGRVQNCYDYDTHHSECWVENEASEEIDLDIEKAIEEIRNYKSKFIDQNLIQRLTAILQAAKHEKTSYNPRPSR